MKKLFAFFVGVVACGNFLFSQSQPKVFKDWSSVAGSQNFFQKNRTVTDGSGNVFVAGGTLNSSGNYDILVAKYNSSGVQQWTQQYNGAGNNQDMATGLYVDGSGNVYITGVVTTSTNIDMVTIKYNSSGTQQWLSTYNGAGSTYDCGADLITDGSGNVYACGGTYNASGNLDFVTIKYNSSGTQQWATVYAHSSGMDDAPTKIGSATIFGTLFIFTTGAVCSQSKVHQIGFRLS